MTFVQRLSLHARFKWLAPFRPYTHASFRVSHAQFGEDMVARALLDDPPFGTYVDVGAHHPVYYSNTYYFYRRGWRGVNIDALPGSMEAFNVLRPRDINVEACLAAVGGEEATFYRFNPPALSTLDPGLARQRDGSNGARIVAEHKLRTETLDACLDRLLPPNQVIDLLNIDVEGLDEQILLSVDWPRRRPRLLIFERHELDLSGIGSDPLVRRLQELNYRLAGKCGPSVLMLRNEQSGLGG